MFTPDLLHDADAEIARLSRQVADLEQQRDGLSAENAALADRAVQVSAERQVWDWFATGGPEDDAERDRVARHVASDVLREDRSPSLASAAAVTLVQETTAAHSDATLVNAAVACQRLLTWVELAQARLTQELAWRFAQRERDTLLAEGEQSDDVAAELAEQEGTRQAVAQVAVTCRLGDGWVRSRLDMVTGYADEHPVLHRALIQGAVSTTRAKVIADETGVLGDIERRSWVERQILPVADALGIEGLRKRLERLIAQADPDRYQGHVEEQDPRVAFRQLGYGQVAMTLTANAHTMAQVRAGLVFRTRLADAPGASTHPNGPPDRSGGGSQADTLIDLITELGCQPSLFDGAVPPTGGSATTDPAPDVPARNDSAPETPAPETPTPETPTPHTPAPDAPAPDSPSPAAPTPETAVRVEPKVCLNVTVPLSVLLALATGAPHPVTALGLSELEGHGPIPASLVREIVVEHGSRATWRCHYLDDRPDSPTAGCVVGVGRAASDTGYTPSPMMRALVQARDRLCRFPGCRRPASRCDLDHVVPYARGGPTCEDNLITLCRHHHRLKHHGRFTPTLDPITGAVTWTTPTGHLATTESEYPPTPPPEPPPPF